MSSTYILGIIFFQCHLKMRVLLGLFGNIQYIYYASLTICIYFGTFGCQCGMESIYIVWGNNYWIYFINILQSKLFYFQGVYSMKDYIAEDNLENN